MKYCTAVTVVLAMLMCVAVPGNTDAKDDPAGTIYEVEGILSRGKVTNPIVFAADIPIVKLSIEVTGSVEDGDLWVACSYYHSGEEIDLRPQKVGSRRGGDEREFAVRFRDELPGIERTEDGRAVLVPLSMVVPCNVCLWRSKVSERKCAQARGGKACDYCRKNGYHMEGRVDRASGTAAFSMVYH